MIVFVPQQGFLEGTEFHSHLPQLPIDPMLLGRSPYEHIEMRLKAKSSMYRTLKIMRFSENLIVFT